MNSIEKQTQAWLEGNPIHNKERDECCPDFSCCQPELLAPYEVRKKFVEADDATRHKMLGMFLGACIDLAFKKKGKKNNVHIAGDEPTEIH